jgi:hypothetical protein
MTTFGQPEMKLAESLYEGFLRNRSVWLVPAVAEYFDRVCKFSGSQGAMTEQAVTVENRPARGWAEKAR